jgi:hypothetical protein
MISTFLFHKILNFSGCHTIRTINTIRTYARLYFKAGTRLPSNKRIEIDSGPMAVSRGWINPPLAKRNAPARRAIRRKVRSW